jgi:bifunctional DNase/RNase
LFKNFADRFDIVVKQVIIHKLVDGVFFSSLICERNKIEEIIDARTSDAIALALRFDAPIFTYKNILDKAGIYLKVNPSKDDENAPKEDSVLVDDVIASELEPAPRENYTSKSLEELQKLLDDAVANEDYEKAAHIRDEISKRK